MSTEGERIAALEKLAIAFGREMMLPDAANIDWLLKSRAELARLNAHGAIKRAHLNEKITELRLFVADLQRQLAACKIVIADAAIAANKDLHAQLAAANERIAGLEAENGRLQKSLEAAGTLGLICDRRPAFVGGA